MIFTIKRSVMASQNSLDLLNPTDSKAQIKFTFDLLNRGETEIILNNKYKDIVFVFGNTGSGKSTFTQWVAGDSDALTATELTNGSGEYVIVDKNNKISNSTIKSQTLFPELVIDENNTAYYDCPGFSDTRSTSHDIAVTYFIKKVVDHAERVKIIFVVSYPSVRKGVDRKDFMELIDHATNLIKDVKKFKKSIALVVTKVDNQYVRRAGNFLLLDDETVIGNIADFLQEIRQNLGESDVNIIEDKIKLVDVLLMKDKGEYSRIGIFRRPDQAGPVTKISILQKEKKRIQDIVLENLKFAPKASNDFGYTISDKSKNDISDFSEEINRSVWGNIRSIGGHVDGYYRSLVEELRNRIKSLISDSGAQKADPVVAKLFLENIDKGFNVTSCLVKDLGKLTNMEELPQKLLRGFATLNIDLPKDELSNIENQAKYFNFLEIVSGKRLSMRAWGEPFTEIISYLKEVRHFIQNDVGYAVDKVMNQIEFNLAGAAKVIKKHYYEKIERVGIQNSIAILEESHILVNNLVKEIHVLNTTRSVIKTIYNAAKTVNVNLPNNDMTLAANRGTVLEFLEVLSETIAVGQKGFLPFQEIAKDLYLWTEWYKFLDALYKKLSTYEVQKKRANYNVADVRNWGKAGKSQGIKITGENFGTFVSKMGKDYLKKMGTNEVHLNELNYILNVTLKINIEKSCNQNELVIRGDFIRFQDFISDKGEINLGVASNGQMKGCKNVSVVNVFALNTLFIDQDIKLLDKKPDVAIIAPRWEVIGIRKFELNGTGGLPLVNSRIDKHGRPGNPGGPGGAFLGVGNIFAGGTNLVISVEGGMGGAGENGRDGSDGSNGFHAIPELSRKQLSTGSANEFLALNGQYLKCKMIHSYQNVIQGIAIFSSDYHLFGKPGGPGEDGGNGGRGGKGGHPGNITLIQLSEFSGVVMRNISGIEGKSGLGGLGGRGGINGDDLRLSYDSRRDYSPYESRELIFNERYASSGKNGTDGFNTQGMQNPKQPKAIPNSAQIFIKYKRYLRENLGNRFFQGHLIDFDERLNSNSDAIELFTTIDLVSDVNDLEEQFHKLKEISDIVPIYRSLLNLISRRHPSSTSINNKKVQSYLYTFMLSKIYNLKNHPQSNLIVNITSYLKLVKKNIYDLQNLKQARIKTEMINNYTEDYGKRIDAKIQEATELIGAQITPELESIGAQLDEEIERLIVKVLELETQAEVEKQQLIKQKEELKNAMNLRHIFSVFKVVSQALSFLGPFGEISNLVIGTATSVTESLVLDDNFDPEKTELPKTIPNLQSLRFRIKNSNDQKLVQFKNFLEDAMKEIGKHPDKLGHLSKKVIDINKRFKKVNQKRINMKELQLLETELKDVLESERLKLKPDVRVNSISENAVHVVEKIAQSAALGLDIYNKYRGDEAKLRALNDAISQREKKFQELKQYENNIKSVVVPMVQNMEDELREIANALDNKSRVQLDVTKWKVQSSLKDMKLLLRQLTENFQIKDNLMRSIEKLDEVMAALIVTYDHIQNYQEQKQLATYISNIFSAGSANISVGDLPLVQALDNLNIRIRSNIVIQQHKIAVDALKQFVFPFAQMYLNEFTSPSRFLLDTNTTNIIHEAASQINSLGEKFDEYKASIWKQDEYLNFGEFSSSYILTKPFFVWKNEEYSEQIANLLSGEEITIKADVTQSPVDKDAIKFRTISFNLKAHNESAQLKIDETLRGFQVNATHLGNSYYRFDDKIYLTTSTSQTIQFSFQKNSDGEPAIRNFVYIKLKAGDFMLSPYALWKVRLIKASEISFDQLKIYQDQVDLELAGSGSFINRGSNVLDLMVDKHYKAVDQIDPFTQGAYPSEIPIKRRNVRSQELEIGYSTSGASASVSSSINSIFKTIRKGLLKITGMNPLNYMEDYFRNSQIGELRSVYSENTLFGLNKNVTDGPSGLTHRNQFSVELIGNEDCSSGIMTPSSIHKEGTLLLLDLFVRRKSRIKYKKVTVVEHLNSDYAQNLAYSAFSSES